MNITEARVRVKFVQQLNDSTCGHACLSMVTGLSLEDIVGRFGLAPIADEIEAIVLTECGLLPVPMIQIGGVMHFAHGVYLVTVPSINRLGLGHRVVLRVSDSGFEIFDPQLGREGKEAYPRDAMSGGTPALKNWAQVVHLHPLFGHNQMGARIRRYEEGGWE